MRTPEEEMEYRKQRDKNMYFIESASRQTNTKGMRRVADQWWIRWIKIIFRAEVK